MTAFVVDTNVAILANLAATRFDLECQLLCVQRINSITKHEVVAIDEAGEILEEYGKSLRFSGMPGAGHMFFKYLIDHQWWNDRVRRVAITKSADDGRGFDELPDNTLDRSDRKFLAVAVVANAILLNATDSDWEEQTALTETLGVKVDQLCPQHASKAARPRR